MGVLSHTLGMDVQPESKTTALVGQANSSCHLLLSGGRSME